MKNRPRKFPNHRLLLIALTVWAALWGSTVLGHDNAEPDPTTKRKQQELMTAVKKGEAAEVVNLLGEGVDPDAPLARSGLIFGGGTEIPGGTPLQWAARAGRADILRLLLKAGADPRKKGLDNIEFKWPTPVSEDGWSALGWVDEAGPARSPARAEGFLLGHPLGAAALSGDLESVRTLVEEAGLPPDDRELTNQGEELGWNALIYSAIGDHPSVAAYLLQRGADSSLEEAEWGYRALHFAARTGSSNVVRILVGTKSGLEARDRLGQTPLHLAATNNDPACCRVLLAAGADLRAKTKAGWTPLHLAAINGRASVCEALLDAGAAVDPRDDLGRTPLHLAAAKGRHDACLALISRGADPLAKTSAGLTPLHFAAASGDVNTLLLFHQAGGDVNGQDALGYTPLHYAAWLDREPAAALLLLRGARANAEGDEGYTPLHLALLEDSRNTVPLLLLLGADPNAPDHDGWTPLHVASARAMDYFESKGPWMFGQGPQREAQAQEEWKAQQRCQPIYRLLEFGARPNVRNKAGQTPLHVAAGAVTFVHMGGGSASLQCRALLDHGAEVNTEDSRGRTPLDVAVLRHSSEAEEVLNAAGGKHGTYQSKQELSRWLMAAIDSGDVTRVRELLDQGADPNAAEQEEDPPLVAATRARSLSFSMEEVGEAIVQAPLLNDTPERKASKREIVSLLLARGSDPNKPGRGGETALYAITESGDSTLLDLLLKAGSDPNRPDASGRTPLHVACRFAMTTARPIVEALVAGGAKLDARDEEGQSPADLARQEKYLPITEFLDHLGGATGTSSGVGGGADESRRQATDRFLAAVRTGDREGVRLAVAAGAYLNSRDSHGETAVYVATQENDAAMLQLLADLGADLSAPNRWGRTAFDLAVGTSEELTRWFAERGALPKGKGGGPPDLRMVGNWLEPKTIRFLLSLGFAVDAPPGETSYLASVAVYPELVKPLLDVGANPNARGRRGWTALHGAANGFERTYSQASVDMLIAAGADLNAADDDGRTPAHEAVDYRRAGMLDALARAGADLTRADKEGVSPQLLAMNNYDLEMYNRIRRWLLLSRLDRGR
jgi:ankyrin repeat protein